MEEEKRNNKNILKVIVIIILLLISGVLVYLNINTISKINKSKDLNEKNTTIYNEKSEELNKIKNSEEEIQKEIDDINNLDNSFAELKKEYFSNIKKLEDLILKGKSKKKIAYITFDDGPYYQTYKVLDLLEKHDINVTFFNIGAGKETCFDNGSADCTKLYKKIAEKDHTIANHTYSHAIFNGLYSSVNSFITQVKKQENLIKKKTGLTTNIVRFPGGSSTAGGLKNGIIKQLRKMKYGWVDWTAQDGDGGDLKSEAQALSYFKSSINDKIEVILFHDYSTITYSILPEAIDYLKSNGYIMLPLFYESNMINK